VDPSLLKICDPQVSLCLLTFRNVTLKQLNSMTMTIILSCLDDRERMHRTALSMVPVSISGSDNEFYVCLLVLLLLRFMC